MASIACPTSEPTLAATTKPQTLAVAEMLADSEEPQYLLLHLVRVLALYVYVFLSQNPLLADDALVHHSTELSVSPLERELHAVLLACVEADVASNQFDGLVQEKCVFVAIKKLFRLERVKPATQCKALLALLASYLTGMTTPIVTCAPVSMVGSTLEYLAATERTTKDVSLSLLYPIVNAVDSLRIEQRECLDALTTLWKWLAARDPSDQLLPKLVSRHQSAVIQVSSTYPQQPAVSASTTALSACFVTTLLRYSDHIFRHDPEHCELPLALESDTEEDDEDVSESEQSTAAPPLSLSLAKPPTPTLPLLTAAEVEVARPVGAAAAASTKTSPSRGAKTLSKSMRRRKKKADEKLASVPVAKAQSPLLLLPTDDARELETGGGNQRNPAEDESLATVVCVGIAAAAGTIAAALCVIFT